MIAKEESLWQSLFAFFLGTCVCVFLSSTIVRMCVFLKETTRELRVEEEREAAPTIGIRATRFKGRPWRAVASAVDGSCAADMEASAAVRGERVATATRGESADVRCDVVRAKSTVVAETRRSRRTCVVAQRSRRLVATTVEARGTEPRRPRRTSMLVQRLWWRGVAAWRPRRCRAIRRGGEPGATGACYGCALDASGASGPRARVRACVLRWEEAYVAVVLKSVLKFGYILPAFVASGCHGGRGGDTR